MSAPGPRCPVCGGASFHDGVAGNWGEWRRCSECTHVFADPLPAPAQMSSLLDAAYSGAEDGAGMADFADRLKQRDALLVNPSLWFWTPAYEDVLSWLRTRVPPTATVVDIGPGPGFFLHALRSAGFRPVGIDVAEPAVDLSRRDGFLMWHGTVDSLPERWVHADAVVAFFMLHHVVDPPAFLRRIRELWPNAPLAIGQYGPTNLDPIRSLPPRMLHRWNARALGVALEQAGYTPKVRQLRSTGVELEVLKPFRGVSRRFLAVPWLYRAIIRVVVTLLPKMLRRFRREDFVLLAFAEPRETRSPL
jgi:methyltransferase family protein